MYNYMHVYLSLDPAYQVINADYSYKFNSPSDVNNINNINNITINKVSSIISNVTSSLWSSIIGNHHQSSNGVIDDMHNDRSGRVGDDKHRHAAMDSCHGIIIHLFIDSSQV